MNYSDPSGHEIKSKLKNGWGKHDSKFNWRSSRRNI